MDIYVANIENINIDKGVLSNFPTERRDRITSSLRKDKARALYASTLLTEYVLSKNDAKPLKKTSSGKPYSDKYKISISHSGKYALVILSEKNEIGIDVQEKKEYELNVAGSVLSNIQINEIKEFIDEKESKSKELGTEKRINRESILSGIKRKQLVSYAFSRKEAFLKCLGTGFEGKVGSDIPLLIDEIEYQGGIFSFFDIKFDENYFMSLCVKEMDNTFSNKEFDKRIKLMEVDEGELLRVYR